MATSIKIISKPIAALIGYERNARTHSDEQIAQIAGSITEYGWTNPILIDENSVIIAGHGRLCAAVSMGLVDAPCIVLKGLTDTQKKAYRIADNKLALNAGWDEELLSAELSELVDAGWDMEFTGFNQAELDNLLDVELPKNANDLDIPFEGDEARSGVSVKYVAFDGHKIPLTEDESESLASAVDRYVEETGSYFGFFAALLEAK